MKQPAYKQNQRVIFDGDPHDYPLIKNLKSGDIGTVTLVVSSDPRPSYFVEFIHGHAGEVQELDIKKM